MKAILFGTMGLWKKGMDIVNSFHPQFELIGFCTPEQSSLTQTNDLVYSLEAMRDAYLDRKIGAVIIIDGSQQKWIRVFGAQGIDRIYAIPSKYLVMEEIPSEKQIDTLHSAEELLPELSQLEMHLADHCNLNCKGCSHFSNLVPEPVFADYEQFQKDIKRLTELFDNIRAFFFLGGEPLLNQEAARFLYSAREAFPYTMLNLVSNGLLVMKMNDSLIRAMRETGCELSISNYDCLETEKIELFLQERGIGYDLRQGKGSFIKYLNTKGDGNEEVYQRCGRKYCTFLRNGRIAACAQPFTIKYFNQYFQEHFSDEGSISLYEKGMDGRKLLEYLEKPMDACRFCTFDKEYEWIGGGKIQMTDWCVE